MKALKKFKVVGIFLVLTLTMMFAGCNSSKVTPSEGDAVDTTTSEKDTSTYQEKNESSNEESEELVIGVSIDKLFPGRQAEMAGVEEAAEQEGVKIITSVADGDAQKQNSQIQTFINKKVNAIMVVAVDDAAIATATRAAKKAGIPVVTFDRALPDNPDVSYLSGLDSYADGLSCGKYLAELNDGKPHKVLELLGALNDQNAIERSKGFEDGIKDADNLEIIKMPTDWNADKALSATQNALQANPDIWAIFIPSDFMLPSIETALNEAGRLKKIGEDGHIISIAIDGSKPGYESTAAGTNDAVVALPLKKVGAAALRAAKTLAEGGTIEKEKELFPGVLYTHENIKDNADKIWGAN